MSEIPLLMKDEHRAFADLVLAGHAPATAYNMAGFKAKTPQSRATAASRLLKNVDIAGYIAAVKAKVQERAVEAAFISAVDKRTKYARIFRCNILKIDPSNPDDPNADLIKKVKIKEDIDANGNPRKVTEFEIHDAMTAARDDTKISGDDPEANALQQLADILAKIGQGGGTLPVDRM